MEDKKYMLFAAINKYDQENILTPIETDSHKGFISCGENNQYLEYLRSLYLSCTTLKSCIDTATDYVCGNGIGVGDETDYVINDRGETVFELAQKIMKDYFTFGGYAVNVVRNRIGEKSLYYIPFERLRSDEYNTRFYYSKDWTKSWGRVKTTQYPAYSDENVPSSIYYFNNNHPITTYPVAPWITAIECAEMQRRINQFHLNCLANGFSGSYLITFNNGIPNQEQADEIENDLIEKFTGTENAGRIAVSFANDKEHSAELQKLEIDDFGEKYNSLIERSRDEILNSFRLNGQLIGINKENMGFNTQEFAEAFKLYNRTVIKPLQRNLVNSLISLTDKDITIQPFTLE